MRLIDADKLKKHYAWWEDDRQELFDSIVDQQPTVDAVPVVHGHWIYDNFGGVHCSACGETCACDGNETYCPWCGAKMDE